MENPGGQMAKKPLVISFQLDESSSMGEDGKIQALNTGLLNLMPILDDLEKELGNVELKIMAITFSSNAQWIIPTPTPIKDVTWPTLKAHGSTEMGKAFKKTAKQMNKNTIPVPGYNPVIILVSDGQPNGGWKAGLQELNQSDLGAKSIRAAIGIGNDCDYSMLQEFIGNPEIKPLRADNPEEIKNHIRTVTLKSIHDSIIPNKGAAQNIAVTAPNNPANNVGGNAANNQIISW